MHEWFNQQKSAASRKKALQMLASQTVKSKEGNVWMIHSVPERKYKVW